MQDNCIIIIIIIIIAGDHRIDVSYFDCPLPCSPFTVKVWDICKVRLTEVLTSPVNCPTSFNGKSYAKCVTCACTRRQYRLSYGLRIAGYRFTRIVITGHRSSARFMSGYKLGSCPEPPQPRGLRIFTKTCKKIDFHGLMPDFARDKSSNLVTACLPGLSRY